jgi:hypothetical protein
MREKRSERGGCDTIRVTGFVRCACRSTDGYNTPPNRLTKPCWSSDHDPGTQGCSSVLSPHG